MMSLTRDLLLFIITILNFLHNAASIILDPDDPQSIRDAAATAVHGVQQIYNGNDTGAVLGKFPYPPYYWWESGEAWQGMVTYWHFTGDASYNNVTYNALVSQLGPAGDFVMPSESFDEGNDDQAFWVLAAMAAAEYGFQSPPAPWSNWTQVCANAFNDYVSRWNTTTCNGGLQWQFYPSNAGYYYKNGISNGAFFQLSARLARMTGNQTYFNWANKIYDWSVGVGLVDNNYNVFDGTDDTINCSQVDHNQWSYNIGVYLYAAGIMQNYTNASSTWVERTAGFLAATSTFVTPFPNATDIIFEAQCEKGLTCDVDQLSFKSSLARWLATTSVVAPFTAGQVGAILRASAVGASYACTAGPYGNTCGSKWYTNTSDGTSGLGQQLSAMEVMYTLLVNETEPPMTQSNVRIRDEPASITSAVSSLLPNPTNSARPLYDIKNEASRDENLLITMAISLMIAVFSMVIF